MESYRNEFCSRISLPSLPRAQIFPHNIFIMKLILHAFRSHATTLSVCVRFYMSQLVFKI